MKNSKFLYFRKKENFLSLVATFPSWLSPICFIEDSDEIWFNGHFFKAGLDSLKVSEMNNNVIVSLAESYFKIVPGTNSINITALGNSIIVSCDALTKIDTDDYLEWNNQILSHKDSGVLEGSYGPSSNQTDASTFTIPQLIIDKKGHVTTASTKEIKIRDFTEQRKSDLQNLDRPILISELELDNDSTSITRKGKNVTYNNFNLTLKVPNIEVSGTKENSIIVKNGDLVVEQGIIIGKLQGEITGSATPKIHISETPDYGGASINLYGHVKLIDLMPLSPQPSSSNSDINNLNVDAVAASPYLVFNYVQALKIKVNAVDASKNNVDASNRIDFTEDFVINNNNQLSIRWTEL